MGGAIPPPVVPAATPAAPVATPAPVPVGEATVVALPERLQDIARPVVLPGTVLGETPEGLTRIRTAAGEVQIDSPTPLPTDKPVTLQITPGQAGPNGALQAKPTALILLQSLTTASGSAAGAPAPAGPTPGNAGAPAVILPAPASPTAPATLPALLPGTVVPALVLASATATKPLQPPAAALPPVQPAVPGTLAAAPPTGSAPPAAGGNAPPTAAPAMTPPQAGAASPFPTAPMLDTPVELGGDAAHPGAETPTLKPANPSANPSANPDAPDLPRGATVALKILTITPPPQQPGPPGQPDNGAGRQAGTGQGQAGGDQPPMAPPTDPLADLAPDAPILRGTVAGTTPQGQPILATRQGMLALNVPASLPQGAQVTAALADPARAARQAAQAATLLPGGELGPPSERDWPAMRQLMATLAAADPALARSMLATMPQPNRKLTAALTFFLSAMRGGDARGWLGDEAGSALERSGRGDLLARLDREFEGLKREAAEPMPGDWRPYTLPMMDSDGPKPIKLHIHPLKGEEGGDGKEKAKPGSRFLIDVEMSRLGPMQLDGLVRPNHFDLILRSHVALPPELRVELIQVFADSVRAVGYSGGLSFQSGAKSWVKLTRAGRSALGVSA